MQRVVQKPRSSTELTTPPALQCRALLSLWACYLFTCFFFPLLLRKIQNGESPKLQVTKCFLLFGLTTMWPKQFIWNCQNKKKHMTEMCHSSFYIFRCPLIFPSWLYVECYLKKKQNMKRTKVKPEKIQVKTCSFLSAHLIACVLF